MSNAKLVQAVFQYYIKFQDLYHLFCGTNTHTHLFCGTHTHTYTHIHTKTHTHAHTHAHKHTQRHTHKQTHTHTHTNTHTSHAHTLSTLSKYISELKQK